MYSYDGTNGSIRQLTDSSKSGSCPSDVPKTFSEWAGSQRRKGFFFAGPGSCSINPDGRIEEGDWVD